MDQNIESLKRVLIQRVYEDIPPVTIASIFITLIMSVGLWVNIEHSTLILWFSAVCIFAISRLILLYIWRRHPSLIPIHQWGGIFCVVSFLSGCLYAIVITLLEPSMPISIQVLILVFAISVPVTAISSYGNYLPAFYSFIFPLQVTFLFWTISIKTDTSITLASLCIIYTAGLLVLANSFNRSVRTAITIQQSNTQLIEDLSRSNNKLEKMTYIDPLTGLSNRHTFHEMAEEIVGQVFDDQLMTAVMRIDLDNFNALNIYIGEDGGDYLLMQIATRLQNSLKSFDHYSLDRNAELSRFGEDEFLALLVGSFEFQDLQNICKRTMHYLTQPVTFNDKTVIPSLSIGVSFNILDERGIHPLMKTSIKALNQVKDGGKNNFLILSSMDHNDRIEF